MNGWGVVEHVFLDGVLAQARYGGQPAGDRGAGAPRGFEIAGEQLDVGTPDDERAQLPLAAPGGELARVLCVRLRVRPE